jgi:hypothetical protein
MLQLNRWLASAKITCHCPDKDGRWPDSGERWLRRIFNNGRLDNGGRLYGGFWIPMNKDDRVTDVTIKDEPVVSLDFGQCAINIAYAEMGAVPPEGDLYLIPGLEDSREGVKALLNAQLHRPSAMTRVPRGTRRLFPTHLKVEKVIELIAHHHPAIQSLFYKGFGMKGFFIESEIMMRSLLALKDRGIVALPVHDCLVVALPDAEAARDVMRASFREVTGAMVDVEIEGVCGLMPSGTPWPEMVAMPWIKLLVSGQSVVRRSGLSVEALRRP